MRVAEPLYPRGPRSAPGYAAPVHQRLCGPIRPTRGHSAISLLAAYTPCLRCAFPPRRPAAGSVLSPRILSRHVVLCDSGESGGCMHRVLSPPTLAFVSSVQTRHSRVIPHIRFPWGARCGELHYGSLALRPADLFICSPSCRIGPDLHPAHEDLYCRALDGWVARAVAGYRYGGNWAISTRKNGS